MSLKKQSKAQVITLKSELLEIQAAINNNRIQREQLKSQLDTLHAEWKSLIKRRILANTEITAIQTEFGKVKQVRAKSDTGLVKPIHCSNQMSEFLNLPVDSTTNRTAIMTAIINYIHQHNLQSPDDKRNIILDDKLKVLLNYAQDTIKMYNIRKLIEPHILTTF